MLSGQPIIGLRERGVVALAQSHRPHGHRPNLTLEFV
jgi:hypothetical protein